MPSANGHHNDGQGANGKNGANRPRAEWIARRMAENPDGNFSQMHYARRGVITGEMEYVARKEKLPPEMVRDEVARGRMKAARYPWRSSGGGTVPL